MPEQLTAEEISIVIPHMRNRLAEGAYAGLAERWVVYTLAVHDRLERLRTLQPKDVTEEHLGDWLLMGDDGADRSRWYRELMAAAVRVVVSSLDKPADTA